MKKLLTIIVPLAMLVAFASVSLADEATQSKQELNQELNKDISDDVVASDVGVRDISGIEDGDSSLDPAEMNQTNTRESRSIATKRGRQPRRGQSASELSEVQKYWGDHNSGKSADEDLDEDEEPPETPYGP